MSSRKRRRTALAPLSVFLFITLCPVSDYAAQQAPLPPTATAEEVRIYEAFRGLDHQPAGRGAAG